MEPSHDLLKVKYKFDAIREERPSTLRSTIYHGLLYWIYGIPGVVFLFIGGAFVIAYLASSNILHIISEKLFNREGDLQPILIFQLTMGLFLLLVSLALLFVARLCRRIITRNSYIDKLENVFHLDKEERNT